MYSILLLRLLSVANLSEVAVFATFNLCGLRKLQIKVEDFFNFLFYSCDKFLVEINDFSFGFFSVACWGIFIVVDR